MEIAEKNILACQIKQGQAAIIRIQVNYCALL